MCNWKINFHLTKLYIYKFQKNIYKIVYIIYINFHPEKKPSKHLPFQQIFTCSKSTRETQEKKCEICSKLTIETPKRLLTFEHISQLF